MFKVDVFILKDSDVAAAEMDRRVQVRITDDPASGLFVASAEDTVVQKLVWFRDGGEVSERQWNDAQGVIRVQGVSLDLAYMRRIARALGVDGQLRRALEASGLAHGE